MKKSLVSLTARQDTILRSISKELEISLSELVRRAVDDYIDSLAKDGAGALEMWDPTTKELICRKQKLK